jgi:fibronectin-binding autotransporter adhesin
MVPGNPGPVTNWALPADGSFSTASNWTGNATPNSTDPAIVNNGTTATVTGTSSVANLETGVGYSNADGNVAVNGGNLSTTGTIATGVNGTGTLAFTNGGMVTDTTTVIGQDPGSNGTATSSDETTIGESGAGTLAITNGGTVND